jgi:tripartite ATP-independent transporter DctM subunit
LSVELLLVIAMFGSFLAGLFLGFPVAFVLGGVGVLFAILGDHLQQQGVDIIAGVNFIGFTTDRIFSTISNYALVPMSLFVFMGFMLERSGVAERLLDALTRLLSRMPGGLTLAVVLIGVVLAASTGIIGASVVLLATVALPALRKAGYDLPLSLGTVASSGCLGILLPPSIMLIVMADQLRLSVGNLFMAAVLPGLILAVLYSVYLFVLALSAPHKAPRVTDQPPIDLRALAQIVLALLPPVALMVAVLGSIFMGIASPTEASGLGAFGAMIIAALNRSLNWKSLRDTCYSTARTTAFLFAIIFGATCFSVVLRGYGGDDIVKSAVTGLPFGPHGVLGIVLLTVFLLGFVLDWMEIVLIVAPLTVPALVFLGFDPIWLAMLFAVCLQTSFLTPPVGMAIFYVKSVSPPEVTTWDIYRGIAPFVLLQIAGLAIVWALPQTALWLPSIAYR